MSELWFDTLLLMLLGMGTVFVFLLLLIASVYVMTAIVKAMSPVADELDNALEVAVVVAAVQHHHTQLK